MGGQTNSILSQVAEQAIDQYQPAAISSNTMTYNPVNVVGGTSGNLYNYSSGPNIGQNVYMSSPTVSAQGSSMNIKVDATKLQNLDMSPSVSSFGSNMNFYPKLQNLEMQQRTYTGAPGTNTVTMNVGGGITTNE